MNNDSISREALKANMKKAEEQADTFEMLVEFYEQIIDNAPPVEHKQDELLDYIKLSLKQSDEFKEKYKNRYKESNSQHDLYYSHLFEGMAEAYADLLEKMGKSDTQGESKQGEWIPMNPDCRGYSDYFKCSICGAYIYPNVPEKELVRRMKMTIVNQAGCVLFIDGNEVEPQEEYNTSEMMFNTQAIFSDIGAVEITTEYSERSFRCFGNLEAYENKGAKDKQGLPVIVIINKVFAEENQSGN